MRQKPLLRVAAGTLALAFVAWVGWLASRPRQLSAEDANRIQRGMSVDEVIAILGRPPDRAAERPPPTNVVYSRQGGGLFRPERALCPDWESEHVFVRVWLHEGRVIDVQAADDRPPSHWSEFVRWFDRLF
jgi:hypothetical protein